MDLFEGLFEFGQQQRIGEIAENVEAIREKLRQEHQGPDGKYRTVGDLAAENIELKLRLGSLVRLLISKQIITVEEYAAMIAEARSTKV